METKHSQLHKLLEITTKHGILHIKCFGKKVLENNFNNCCCWVTTNNGWSANSKDLHLLFHLFKWKNMKHSSAICLGDAHDQTFGKRNISNCINCWKTWHTVWIHHLQLICKVHLYLGDVTICKYIPLRNSRLWKWRGGGWCLVQPWFCSTRFWIALQNWLANRNILDTDAQSFPCIIPPQS